jgi:hypothetical protein
MSKTETMTFDLARDVPPMMRKIMRDAVKKIFADCGVIITDADLDFIDEIKDLPKDQQAQRIKERARGQT